MYKLCRKEIKVWFHWCTELGGSSSWREEITFKLIIEPLNAGGIEECIEKNLKLVMGSPKKRELSLLKKKK